MNPPSRFSVRAWLLGVLVAAVAWLSWTSYWRAQRVIVVSNTDRADVQEERESPTGYPGGKRWLIVPEHNNRSYQWIAETQQMLATREWRVRRVATENAPYGREVSAPSPYRWWLATVAWLTRLATGDSVGASVERAALWADPALQVALVVFATFYVARQFGAVAGIAVALGSAAFFPLSGSFLPGVPSDRSLSLIAALGSLLPLLVVPRPGEGDSRPTALRFGLAGLVGGLGLWLNPGVQAPLLCGLALGGGVILAFRSQREILTPRPWRWWALSGAATSLAAYFVEYFPGHLDFRLQVNHPLYALAWLGLGELLHEASSRNSKPSERWDWGRIVRLMFAGAAVAALPIALSRTGTNVLFTSDLLASRLTDLPNGTVAKNFATWIARDGVTAPLLATVLTLTVLVLAVVQGLRQGSTDAARRMALAMALGSVTVALVLASTQLAWWSFVDVTLIALVAVLATEPAGDVARPWRPWLPFTLVGTAAVAGIVALLPQRTTAGNIEFTRLEVEGLIERSMAHWLADRAPPEGAVVLLPPDRTVSWCYHGGFRGLGTANWENREGLEATIQIITATTADAAQAQLSRRGVTHVVLPSWDSDLDEFVRWTLKRPEDSFLVALQRWALPPWLQPLPYPVPSVPGFENQSAALIAVTEESNPANALGRLAEYFLEMQDLDHASAAGEKLKQYPADLGALVARANVERARGDEPELARVLADIVSNLGARGDRSLPWDRRVSLAAVLAQAKRTDLAAEQIRLCAGKATGDRLRTLPTLSLYRLVVLARSYQVAFAASGVEDKAIQFLPAELRARLSPASR